MKQAFKRLLLASAVAAVAVTGTARAQTAGDSSGGAQTGTGTTTGGTREGGTVGPMTNPPGSTGTDGSMGARDPADPSGTRDDDTRGTGPDPSPSGTTGGAIDDRRMDDDDDDDDALGDRPPRTDRN